MNLSERDEVYRGNAATGSDVKSVYKVPVINDLTELNELFLVRFIAT